MSTRRECLASCHSLLISRECSYSGQNYINAVKSFVSVLHNAGMYVILDLHWNAVGPGSPQSQQVSADQEYSSAFWTRLEGLLLRSQLIRSRSVANTFINDTAIIFDLYNEPHDITWPCWRDGCTVNGFNVAGMNALIQAVRNTGSTAPIMAGGLAWANDLSQWLAYKPTDPLNRLIASHHSYNFNACISPSVRAFRHARLQLTCPASAGTACCCPLRSRCRL